MKNRVNIPLSFVFLITVGLFISSLNSWAAAGQQTNSDMISGKVTETFDVPGYTYAEVDTGKEKVWAAGPVTPLKVGDMISFSTAMPMENFHSKAVKREFPIIYFSGRFLASNDPSASQTAGAASPHAGVAAPHAGMKQQPLAEPVKGINKVENGNTIAEIHTQKQTLNGKTVRVRGKVTKFTAEVMGRNWIHIKDSSTADDLTVTTKSTVAIDDVVVVEGKLEIDKDFNYGYVYPVILENASVTKE